MPMSALTTNDINFFKDDILDLYLKQDKSLKDVRATMAAQGLSWPYVVSYSLFF
jgi:hypothetical protein